MWEDVQSIAQQLIDAAGQDDTGPVSTIKVALGNEIRVEITQRKLASPAEIEKDLWGWIILLRPRLPPFTKQRYVGHELGEWMRRLRGYQGTDSELVCDAIGLCTQIPSNGLSRRIRGVPWEHIGEVAEVFGVTHAAAAIRISIFIDEPVVIVERSQIMRVGEWGDATDEYLLDAANGESAGVRRWQLETGRRRAFALTPR